MVRFFILNVALAYDKLLGGVEANPLIDLPYRESIYTLWVFGAMIP